MRLLTRLRAASRGALIAEPRQNDGTVPGGRRSDLDWIRVGAFGLLILYHVALVYGPFDWHIRSTHTFDWLREGLLITQPWRLTLLFLVSGAALRFMAGHKPAGAVLGARVRRLTPPLIFGVLLLVPIQSWIEAMDKGFWTQGLIPWMGREFSWAGIRNGVPVNHLWFLLYIAAYTLAAVSLLLRPAWMEWLEGWLQRRLRGWRLLVIPAAYLIIARVVLFPRFGLTNQLIGDWYNHAESLTAFLFGFLLAKRESIWGDFERFRRIGLAVAAVALPVAMLQIVHPGGNAFWSIPRHAVYALDQWAVIVTILGFGSFYLRKARTPILAYLNDAVFPCYLAHQTVLVMAVWMVKPAGLPAAVEAALLIAVTFGGSLAAYEAVRRVGILRPLWGLKPAVGAQGASRRWALAFGQSSAVIALISVVWALANASKAG